MRCPIGRHHQRLLDAPQPLGQAFHPRGQVCGVESTPPDPKPQHGQKAVKGVDRPCAVCPVRRWPPQAGPPALAEAAPLLHSRLTAVSPSPAGITERVPIGEQDGLANRPRRDLSRLAPFPLPAQCLDSPLLAPAGVGRRRPEAGQASPDRPSRVGRRSLSGAVLALRPLGGPRDAGGASGSPWAGADPRGVSAVERRGGGSGSRVFLGCPTPARWSESTP